jgi:transposase
MAKVSTDLSTVTTVGLDIAKYVFQVHGVDTAGHVVVAKAIKRKDVLSFFASLPPCLVGLEACGTSHHWGRELMALGHEVRLMPPAYVKPYVRRQKNDAADAAAICEAVARPSNSLKDLAVCEGAFHCQPVCPDAPQGARDAGGAAHTIAQWLARPSG